MFQNFKFNANYESLKCPLDILQVRNFRYLNEMCVFLLVSSEDVNIQKGKCNAIIHQTGRPRSAVKHGVIEVRGEC